MVSSKIFSQKKTSIQIGMLFWLLPKKCQSPVMRPEYKQSRAPVFQNFEGHVQFQKEAQRFQSNLTLAQKIHASSEFSKRLSHVKQNFCPKVDKVYYYS